MNDHFDLHAYVKRIGYDGPLEPTAETLRELHRHHVQTFPFENLNPLLRWAIPLDGASLQQKMVFGRRGGYCFEQNLLLSYALQTIGFEVTGLAARVLSNRPPDSMPARTHMLLLVKAEGEEWLADAGFGSMTMAEPVKMELNAVQPTTHESRRVTVAPEPRDPIAAGNGGGVGPGGGPLAGTAEARVGAGRGSGAETDRGGEPEANDGAAPVHADDRSASDREFLMEVGIRDEWRPLFRFNLQPQALVDYEMANFYVSNRPGSHFTNGLTAARPTATGRYGLRNNELAVHDLVGNTERTTLTSAAEIRDALEDLFLLEVPSDPKLHDILGRLAAGETIEGT